MRRAGHVERMGGGDRRGAYRVLVGKLEGNIPLRRPCCFVWVWNMVANTEGGT